jgi:hypothetical protein
LRKEILESQKLRTQIIGFKITFVTTGIGLVAANLDEVPAALLIVPGFAAIFFDFLITSYSYSIKRLGAYMRCHLEPHLRRITRVPDELVLWEEYLDTPELKQSFSMWGNLGLTFLAVAVGILGVLRPSGSALPVQWNAVLLLLVAVFAAVDIWASLRPRRFFGFKRRHQVRTLPTPVSGDPGPT